MNSYLPGLQAIVEKYGQRSPPDPAVLFALPNEIRYGANLYGFQKSYEGSFSVDIFFDSAASPSKMDCACSRPKADVVAKT